MVDCHNYMTRCQHMWRRTYLQLGGGNSNIFGFFTPKLGEDEPILTNIFQRG